MSRTNEAFRRHSGPRTEVLRYLDSLPGNIALMTLHVSHMGMCHPKGYGFCAFRSKNGYTLNAHFGIGYGFRGEKHRIKTYLSFQFQIIE